MYLSNGIEYESNLKMAWKCPECGEINHDDSIVRCICGYEMKSGSSGSDFSVSIKQDNIETTNTAGRDVFVAIILALIANAILDAVLPRDEFITYASWVIAQCIIIYLLQQKYPLRISKLNSARKVVYFTLISGLIIFGVHAFGYFEWNSIAPDDYDLFIKYELTHKILFFINGIMIAPVVEEILFRGYFYRILKMRYGIFFALLFSGFLWSSVHNFTAVSLFQSFIFTIIYEKTDNLWYCMIVHSINNLAFYIFYYLL